MIAILVPMLLSLATAPQGPPARPGSAPATIVAEPVALLFAGFDRDGDARVSLAEMHSGLAATVADPAWDTGVGFIAYADWAARWLGDRNVVPTPFDIDRDGDNRITRAELTARITAIFTRLDANSDGSLSRAELLTIRRDTGFDMRGDRRGRDREPPRQP